MKNITLLTICFLCSFCVSAQGLDKANCQYQTKSKSIPLRGKVQFVTSSPDFTIQYVSNFADIDVKFVTSYPGSCGEWQEVTSFPDFKVQVVTSSADIKVREVKSFPGMK